MLENVVVVGGYRTYIGKENGIYRHIPAEKLGGHILHKLSGDYGAPILYSPEMRWEPGKTSED